MVNFKQHLTRITTFLFDIDGVFTDGKVQVMENGEVIRNLYGKDGYAIHVAIAKGYRIAIISGGNNIAVKSFLQRAGIKDVFISQHDKLACYQAYLKEHNLSPEEIVYMGDDLPDYHVMKNVGLAVCPQDSAPEIKGICKYISGKKGGEGCVRDIIEQVLKSQGNWEIRNW
jgi:3-deoxy-D-manno-octulosonate 8-phosphate phosphatase (KDO 8-P phosphatase)